MHRHLAYALIALLVSAGLGPGMRAMGQDNGTASTYIDPFPPGDTYRILVIGDSHAEGMLLGLVEAFGTDPRLQLTRKHRAIASLLKADLDEELKALDADLARERPLIAIVMLGIYDRIPFRPPAGRRSNIGSDDWKAEYGRRVDLVMKLLKRRNIAVYWAGLPPLRRPDANEDAKMMNEIFRERAYLNGQKFIDIYTGFADEEGDYTPTGPDLTGDMRTMRASDGIHFTPAGNRKLANFIEIELKRDLNMAKAARSLPLAGSEAEQKRINPRPAVAPVTSGAPAVPGGAPAGGSGTPTKTAFARPWSDAVVTTTGDAPADNSRVTVRAVGPAGREENVTLDILRPAVPAAVIALITRREGADRAAQPGDPLTTIVGGTAFVSSITATGDGATGPGRRKGPMSQTPYFRVIIKGERLTPKPGRIDDLVWPPPSAAAPGPSPAPAAAPKAAPVAPPAEPAPKRKAG
jgi:hypothetical protein